jgi:hypothetical protein
VTKSWRRGIRHLTEHDIGDTVPLGVCLLARAILITLMGYGDPKQNPGLATCCLKMALPHRYLSTAAADLFQKYGPAARSQSCQQETRLHSHIWQYLNKKPGGQVGFLRLLLKSDAPNLGFLIWSTGNSPTGLFSIFTHTRNTEDRYRADWHAGLSPGRANQGGLEVEV